MASRDRLIEEQRAWAHSQNLLPDSRSYLPTLQANLFQPLSVNARSAFDKGSGSELVGRGTRPAKMRALHSSSALAVNVFDYWSTRDAGLLLSCLGEQGAVCDIKFEEQFGTALGGIPPNLDLYLSSNDGLSIGVESKFAEWLTSTPKNKPAFKEKYFLNGRDYWSEQQLPLIQEFAASIQRGAEAFRYLDVAQLLKHVLGLTSVLNNRFTLLYLYCDFPGPESAVHSSEIVRFMEGLKGEIDFRTMTYQELFGRLAVAAEGTHQSYIEYLGTRYFKTTRRLML